MAGASLLTLLDDIASVLDDVALMSKVAARKTAGVLGDDLALNAEQVSGVAAEREIPVVVAVGRGSLRNKAILVPIALLLSYFVPWLIMPLLVLGGLYLCFEGAEKVLEKLSAAPAGKQQKEMPQTRAGESIAEYEKRKVAGAVRTDFILSAEIIVIALGTVQGHSLLTQIIVVSLIAVIMTLGVYGIVAAIVKFDDLGFYLLRKSERKGVLAVIGRGFIHFAPWLMKLLTVVGTVAMFLVGGGIAVHNISWLHHSLAPISSVGQNIIVLGSLMPLVVHSLLGLFMGLVLVALEKGVHHWRHK